MAREDAAPFRKEFIPVKIDIDRMIGGKDVIGAYPKSEKQGIPWFVFLDAEGKELADSMGPQGNIGCPNSEEEIDAFLVNLKKASASLTADDFIAIKTSLMDHRTKK